MTFHKGGGGEDLPDGGSKLPEGGSNLLGFLLEKIKNWGFQ